ncbi:hypothetical protein M406DRAFT_358284 [Cryphonectria parasitica EP155]|uniref:Uncharacterized protein n=1 Tax=Cryphonectria parasitica (strain ATCC 38755 / EP155) TaxID=660469 RepID=A0A9P5CID3_CRYP1|nr:uncharacterized protein M406DRAFT_358284 [Cryphonectria parasitica EP155]KAF3760654.1 hypothetical protein M406DRAFT_358284 [Cryphonectria parasitica EP155]
MMAVPTAPATTTTTTTLLGLPLPLPSGVPLGVPQLPLRPTRLALLSPSDSPLLALDLASGLCLLAPDGLPLSLQVANLLAEGSSLLVGRGERAVAFERGGPGLADGGSGLGDMVPGDAVLGVGEPALEDGAGYRKLGVAEVVVVGERAYVALGGGGFAAAAA